METYTIVVLNTLRMPGPNRTRTAPRSFVRRDMTSPVAFLRKNAASSRVR